MINHIAIRRENRKDTYQRGYGMMNENWDDELCKVGCNLKTLGVPAVCGEEEFVERVWKTPVSLNFVRDLGGMVKFIGVTREFKDVVNYFKTPSGETPAGFRIELSLSEDGVLRVDLVRDISYDKNGKKRPTNVLLSADSANPYEIAPISKLIANLTCNPAILYDQFINNPQANVGGQFKTRDEVMAEIGRILGPGCDISVELNNPFDPDFNRLLDECNVFKELLSKWRVVIKVPHTGPIANDTLHELLEGDGKLRVRYDRGSTENNLRGHNLTYRLTEAGFRINFTLMFSPHQTNLALQAKPYFINTFVRSRLHQSQAMNHYLKCYDSTHDAGFLKSLRSYMIEKDYLATDEGDTDLHAVENLARQLLEYRRFHAHEGMDGLDSVRHNLRLLKNCNLPDTRLIVCSINGEGNYLALDKLLAEPEFQEMNHRVVVTTDPNLHSQFASDNQIISYQRMFLNAASTAK
jgi:hypothetical protein